MNRSNPKNTKNIVSSTIASQGSVSGLTRESKQVASVDLSLKRYLTNNYGIGWKRATEICKEFGYLENTPVNRISQEGLTRFESYVRVEKALQEFMGQRVKHKVKIGTYSGIRRRRGLPSRGQHTQTNASTARRLNINRTN